MEKINDFLAYDKVQKQSFSLMLKSLKFASKNSIFYKKFFAEKGIKAAKIRNYAEFKKIPFTTSADFKRNNFDFLALSLSEIWQIFSTSGTTGEPKFYFYDRMKIKKMAGITKLVLERAGFATKNLLAAIFYPLDVLSAGGPIAVRTCESLKVPAIRFGISAPAANVAGRLDKLKPNWFFVFPSTFAKLISELKELDYKPKNEVKIIFSSGEPLNTESRKQIQDFFQPKEIVDILASVDMSAYIASECKEHNGLHFLPSSVFSEVVDTETNEVIEEGIGELVLTSIHSYGTPLVRYKTGDVVKVTKAKCACKRAIPRIWFVGRIDDRIFLQGGRKFFAGFEINEFIKKFPDLTDNYQVIIEEKESKDCITLKIESKNQNMGFAEQVSGELIKFSSPLAMAFSEKRLLKPIVELVEINSLERTGGKIKNRAIDKRNWTKPD